MEPDPVHRLRAGPGLREPRRSARFSGHRPDHGGLHDKDNGYVWTGTGTQETIWDWLDDVNVEGGTGFAGYNDWRIPNIKELQSLVNFQSPWPMTSAPFHSNCVAGATVLTGSCTAPSVYWSSTTWPTSPSMAAGISFYEGLLFVYDKVSAPRVRAVRGGLSGPNILPATGQTTAYTANKNDGIAGAVAVPDDGTGRHALGEPGRHVKSGPEPRSPALSSFLRGFRFPLCAVQTQRNSKENPMKVNKRFQQSVFAVVGFLMAAAAFADGHGNKGAVVQPDEQFFGKTYSELVSEWTDWFVQEPFATNPAFDPDGRYCDRNQDGKVWFLASTFGGTVNRTCEIPAGRAIFVSVGGAFVSFAPEFPDAGNPCLQRDTDVERVRCDVNDDVPVAPAISLQATLDGAPIEDLFAFRAQSQPGGFTLHVSSSSFVTDAGLPAGDRYPAVGDGYFLYLKPLKPGTHTLSVSKSFPGQPGEPAWGVNYTLIIGGGNDH